MDKTLTPEIVAAVDPPPDAGAVLRLAVCGAVGPIVACLLALLDMLIGGEERSDVLDALRVACGFFGLCVVGYAMSLRPCDHALYGVGFVGCVLAWLASPTPWHSLQLLTSVAAALCLVGLVLISVSRRIAYVLVSAAVLFHFGGITTAVTSPDPQPWLTGQLWVRVYRPYLTFTYLTNAYHFYSPDPGPAQLIWACIHYDVPANAPREEKYTWVQFPVRPSQIRDPMGLSYTRRLPLTEQLNNLVPMSMFARPETEWTFELMQVYARRMMRVRKLDPETNRPTDDIPIMVDIPFDRQYQPPQPDVARIILPSYAKHIAKEFGRIGADGKPVPIKAIKIFRVQHRILVPKDFIGDPKAELDYLKRPGDPFSPSTYLAFYQGKYDAEGRLLDPKDPLLWWLIPMRLQERTPPNGGPKEYHFDKFPVIVGEEE